MCALNRVLTNDCVNMQIIVDLFGEYDYFVYFCSGINVIKKNKMARPIRNTPILMGKDAERFLYEINNRPPKEERLKERARIETDAQQFVVMVRNIKQKKESRG